ncbi:hypothetical protein J6590_078835 [Homalodisca vitripennis]|nr:hypothetical protein J6590_078835 [Homalodisca vitripennis]
MDNPNSLYRPPPTYRSGPCHWIAAPRCACHFCSTSISTRWTIQIPSTGLRLRTDQDRATGSQHPGVHVTSVVHPSVRDGQSKFPLPASAYVQIRTVPLDRSTQYIHQYVMDNPNSLYRPPPTYRSGPCHWTAAPRCACHFCSTSISTRWTIQIPSTGLRLRTDQDRATGSRLLDDMCMPVAQARGCLLVFVL